MRVAMLVQGMQKFGGLEEIVATLAVALRRQGHQTSVLSAVWVASDNQYKRYLEANGVPLVQWPFMPLVRPLAWMLNGLPTLIRERSWLSAVEATQRWQQQACDNFGWSYLNSKRHAAWTHRLLAGWCLAWRPDLIHVHSYVYELNVTHVLEWTHARGLPTVFEEHQTPDLSLDVWGDFRRCINQATAVGAVSQKAAKVMRDGLGVRRPITVLPVLVPDPTTPTHDQRKHAAAVDTLTITTIARLIPAKGLPYLFEAIAKVRETHPTIRFLVYGDGPPQQRREIRASAERFGLDTDRTFAGTFRRDELPAIMQAADIFVLASLTEGLPLAVVEAMACRRPIVATTVGGVPDLLQDDVTGLLCPPADAASLTRALSRLVEHPEERARLGSAARQAYEEGRFHPDQAAREHLALYEATLRITRENRWS